MRVFFVLVTLTVLVTQRYLWLRLVRDTRLTGTAKRAATWALIALGASVPISVITWRLTSRAATFPVLSFAWLAFAFYLVGFLVLWDALRALGWGARALGVIRRRPQPTAAEPESDARRVRETSPAREQPHGAGETMLAAGLRGRAGDAEQASDARREGGEGSLARASQRGVGDAEQAPEAPQSPRDAAPSLQAMRSAREAARSPQAPQSARDAARGPQASQSARDAEALQPALSARAMPQAELTSLGAESAPEWARAVAESRLAAQPETRRVFMARAAAAGALAAASGIGFFGVRSALWEIALPEVPVGLRRLPRELDGYTIALLTDVHIGPLLDGRFLRHLAEQTNAARPDMIAICGDLVDGHVSQIGAQVAELRRLQARHGVFFVTGNHEYYSGGSEWVRFLEQLGVRVLMNEHLSIGDAAVGGASFDLAGLPDPHGAWVEGRGPDVALATRGRDQERELVLLAHQPVQIKASASVNAGLQLSGHTHGGQLYPFGAAARLHQPYLAGLHRHQPTETQIYVSRGTGFWGPPMRVLAPAEIALLRLHSA